MKLSLIPLLSAMTTSLSLVVTPELQLQDDLPDSRFKIYMLFDSPLLPVNPTLAVITHFMSVVAQSNFEQVLEPCVYSSTMNPTVTITSHSSTETRFLLWGIYLAAIDMVKYVRFNEMVVNLFWDKQLVGQISVLLDKGDNLASTSLNDTGSFLDDGEGPSLEMIGNRTNEASVKKLNIPTLENGTRAAVTTNNASADSLVDRWNTVYSNLSTLPTGPSSNASLLRTVAVDFQRVAGATQLKRNEVFLTFYAAMLHVAKFPVGNQMVLFDSKAPDVMLRVRMLDIGIGCSVILSELLTPIVNAKQMEMGLTATV